MTTAFTVVEPTSIPIRKFLSMVCSRQDNDCGADPLVRGRRPRRPSRAVVPAAGRGRPARTRGSAPLSWQPAFLAVMVLVRFAYNGRHARRDVVHEIRGAADDTLFVGDPIQRTLGFGIGLHPGAALVQREPGLFQGRGEFLLGLVFGFAKRHLDAAVGVDLAFAGGLDGQVDHVLVVRDYGGLRAIALRAGHAAEGLERKHHVRQVLIRIVDILRHFQVAFPAAGARVVERVAQALQLVLVGKVVRDAAQRVHDLVVFALENGFGELQLGHLLAETELDFGARAQLPEGGQDRAFFETLEVFVLLDDLVDHVHDPGADGFHQNLRAFALQEAEHVEVAVAFGGLRPELAGDLDDGLDAQAIDIDVVKAVAAALQSGHVFVALQLVDKFADVFRGVAEAAEVFAHAFVELPGAFLAEHLMEVIHALVEDAVGVARVHLEGTQRVGHFVHDVAAVERVEDAEEEIEVHFQAGFGVGLGQAARLLEEEHAKAIEAGVAQGEAIFGFIHTESAGSAGAGGEEDVAVDDFLLGNALLFQGLQVLHQVADGEAGGIALAVVAVLFAGLERLHVRGGNGFGAIAEALQGAVHQLFVLPGKSAEQEGGLGALVPGEVTLGGTLEVVDLARYHTGFALPAGPLLRPPLRGG